MDLRLTDPAYTERFASFLRSLGRTALVAGPDAVELIVDEDAEARLETEIYLRVWNVLYPDAQVRIGATA
jgi:hypothetical protein